MTIVYPVILTPAKIGYGSGYAVYVPDLEINTQGYDMAEAIAMARDAIGMKGICEQDEGRAISEPSVTEPAREKGDIVTWVDIDFDKYRRANDMRTVRVNVTVPQYLKDLGEERGINFSQTLQKALKEELKIV
jgi:predicted RNase H-like HicB family nuclease